MATATRKCRHCKERNRTEDMIVTPNNAAFCDDKCASEYGKKRIPQVRKKQQLDERRENKKAIRELDAQDRKKQWALTKKEAQTLANLLDSGLPCICCDEPRGNVQFCGGHMKTAGGHPELALDLRNIHGQRNRYCNQEKSGNIEGDKHSKGYRQGIVDRYGQAHLDWLESHHELQHFTCDELIALRKVYAAEKSYIKKHGKPSRNWRSLDYQLTDLCRELEKQVA